MRKLTILCLGIAALTVAGCGGGPSENTADAIYFGGDIVTMNDAQMAAESVAVKEGKILSVGSRGEIEAAHRGSDTKMVDLAGKTMMPSFIDAHGHFMNALNTVNWANVSAPPVGTATSIADVVQVVEEHQQKMKLSKGEWIIGYGYDATTLEDGCEITRDDLDSHFPDNPVMLIHVSNHGAVLNSLAFEEFGISADTPTPEGGLIARKPGSQEPAGLLMETAFMPIFAQMPVPTEEERLQLLKPAQEMYARQGFTTVQEGATHVQELDLLRKGASQNLLFLDVVSLPLITDVPAILAEYIQTDEELVQIIGNPSLEFGTYDNRLKLGGAKLFVDGSPQGKTAYWTEPLLTPGPAGEKNWRGQPLVPQEIVSKAYKLITDHDIRIWTHANGDAGIDMVIDAARAAGLKAGDDRRHVVVHSQVMRPDQLDDYAELGLTPSFFTAHTYFWGDVHLENLGEERAFFISPMASATEKGIRFTNHNDFMVTPMDAMMMTWTAMARPTRSGRVLGPDQRVDARTALRAITIDAAWQYQEENEKGSIEPGKLADLVILSGNPMTVGAPKIMDIQVVETIKEGKTVYQAQ
jgi:predicted amidohydrolase YtcJ